MAKLTDPNGIGGNRTPRLGAGYIVSEWRGVLRIQAKPAKGKKKISARQQRAMDDFRHLSNAAKNITPYEREAAMSLSAGTQYIWRDLVFMAISGRLFNFEDDNGVKWFSMAARTTVSDILEAISQTPGTMLVRGDNWWDVIPPGAGGQVLTWNGETGMPIWAAGGSGGSVRALTAVITTDQANSSSWPRMVSWQGTNLADWPGWNISSPTNIEFPDDASRFRVTAGLRLTLANIAENASIRLNNPATGLPLPFPTHTTWTRILGSFNEVSYNMVTPWQEIGDLDAIEVRVNRPSSPSSGFLDGSWITVEVA